MAFQTADKVTIRGWFIPAKNTHAPTVILMHGYGGDKGDILPSRLFLHDNYNLLFFDFRYFGKSGGDHSTAGREEMADLEAALDYLHARGIHQIALWGLSMGAAVGLMTAEKHRDIKAIIAEASYARMSMLANHYFAIPLLRYPLGWLLRLWGHLYLGYDIDSLTPEKSSALLRIPILYMHSKADEVIPFAHMQVLEKVAKENPQAQFYIYENKVHAQLPDDYQIRIKKFLGQVFEK